MEDTQVAYSTPSNIKFVWALLGGTIISARHCHKFFCYVRDAVAREEPPYIYISTTDSHPNHHLGKPPIPGRSLPIITGAGQPSNSKDCRQGPTTLTQSPVPPSGKPPTPGRSLPTILEVGILLDVCHLVINK
ncbi:hypothetical protein E2C01_054583 [Portunus trituberculatus]|uniref:Uncharacterized protein n=1 Tax=Portunus trituberculatus TaxID=210409 RepID=A0A5B7GVE9_PORTR|nr:hypothetical protein [Portunus trituberculatus]